MRTCDRKKSFITALLRSFLFLSCFACCPLIKASIITEFLLNFSVPATSMCTFSNAASEQKKNTSQKYLEGHLEPSERQGLLDSLNSTNQEPSNVTQSKVSLIGMMLRGLKFHKIPSSSPVQRTNSYSAQPAGWRRCTASARLQQASWWALRECCRAEERSCAPTGPRLH